MTKKHWLYAFYMKYSIEAKKGGRMQMDDNKNTNSNLEKRKVCVFFGAGAEIKLGLKGGADFAKKVLGIGTDNIDKQICCYYSKENLNDWYPIYRSETYMYQQDKLLKAAIKKEMLESKSFDYKKEYDDEIDKCFKKIKENPNEVNEKIEKYSSYMGILDEEFHTLIHPKALGPQKFWRVVNAYTRAYLCLVENLFKEDATVNYQKILKNPRIVLDKMKEFSEGIVENNYYNELKKMKEQINIEVVTTNYTTLCQHITGLEPCEIAYIHGRFGLFENPRTLEVIDYDKDGDSFQRNSEDVYFPYIFVQSGVKPIVDEIQIKEYNKMIDFFDDSDTIIIVGYNINSDDNHVNSIIRSSVIKGKKVVYLNYIDNNQDNKNNNENCDETVRKKLRIFDECSNLVCINVNGENCIKEFRRILRGC